MVTLAAGGVMFVFSIIFMFLFAGLPSGVSASDLKVGDVKILGLIAGIVVAGVGALGFFPQTKQFVGAGGSVLGGPSGPGGPGGPMPPQGYGPPPGFGQQPPPPPGYGQQPPPPGYGQPPQQQPPQW